MGGLEPVFPGSGEATGSHRFMAAPPRDDTGVMGVHARPSPRAARAAHPRTRRFGPYATAGTPVRRSFTTSPPLITTATVDVSARS